MIMTAMISFLTILRKIINKWFQKTSEKARIFLDFHYSYLLSLINSFRNTYHNILQLSFHFFAIPILVQTVQLSLHIKL